MGETWLPTQKQSKNEIYIKKRVKKREKGKEDKTSGIGNERNLQEDSEESREEFRNFCCQCFFFPCCHSVLFYFYLG